MQIKERSKMKTSLSHFEWNTKQKNTEELKKEY